MRERRPMIYPNEGFRRQLLEMDPSLRTAEERAEVDRYIMMRCLQGLGLFFPQVWVGWACGEAEFDVKKRGRGGLWSSSWLWSGRNGEKWFGGLAITV